MIPFAFSACLWFEMSALNCCSRHGCLLPRLYNASTNPSSFKLPWSGYFHSDREVILMASLGPPVTCAVWSSWQILKLALFTYECIYYTQIFLLGYFQKEKKLDMRFLLSSWRIKIVINHLLARKANITWSLSYADPGFEFYAHGDMGMNVVAGHGSARRALVGEKFEGKGWGRIRRTHVT